MNMDKRLKPCTTIVEEVFCDDSDSNCNVLLVDKLSSLPDELLTRILSLVPTKDAASTCFLSKRLKRVFPLITNLDIDDSPTISHCLEEANNIHHFPSFVTFVDSVVQAHQSQYLTRFRLGVGSDMITKYFYRCTKHCLPDVNPEHIYSWISFPFTRCGLRELDLRIHVREPANGHHLPPEIFTCETLEVLKLDVNLPVDRVSTFRLPTLKLLHLYVSHIYGDGSFVARLVSSCPLLEDLTVDAAVPHVQSIIISSPSLRILNLPINTREPDNTDFLLIHTPNLEYFDFSSNLALRQSITNMDRLIKADICIEDLIREEPEVSCQQMLSIIGCLANVHHLSLLHSSLQDLNFNVLKDQLPTFRNLKYLELGNNGFNYWDKVLVSFLNCSPVLETLVFPQGMIDNIIDKEKLQMEKELCRTGLATIPWCCRFHLKRIVITKCYGNERELDLIQFLLKHALVLEELVVYGFEGRFPHFPVVDKMELQKILQNLPRASVTSSIQVK